MSDVLITGAAGFLGSHLCRRLAADGHNVHGIDILHRDEAWRLRDVKLKSYDWRDVQDVAASQIAPYVIHCAGPVDVGHTQRSPKLAAQQAVHGTVALCEAARCFTGVKRLVLISSYSAYGKVEKQPIVEEESLQPATLYGAMKASQEMAALSYWRSHELPVTVVRLSTLYGEAMRATLPVRLFMSKLLKQDAADQITLTGDGSQVRDQNYVGNAVGGILAALFDTRTPGDVFNLGGDRPVSMLELVRLCADAVRRPADVKFAPPRAGEEGRLYLNVAKARAFLNYTPTVGLEEGLQRTAEWLKRHDEAQLREAA